MKALHTNASVGKCRSRTEAHFSFSDTICEMKTRFLHLTLFMKRSHEIGETLYTDDRYRLPLGWGCGYVFLFAK